METPLGAAQTPCPSPQCVHTHTRKHTLLFAPNPFTAREVPLKSNLSPSCYKLAPTILGMERPGPPRSFSCSKKQHPELQRSWGPGGALSSGQALGQACFALLSDFKSQFHQELSVYSRQGLDLSEPWLPSLSDGLTASASNTGGFWEDDIAIRLSSWAMAGAAGSCWGHR